MQLQRIFSITIPFICLLVLVDCAGISANGIEPDKGDLAKGINAYSSGDYAPALKEIKPLAELGIAKAQMYLGIMYQEGHGVPRNYETALKWYKLAAEQGDAHAQERLGLMYDEGLGVTRNYETAFQWFMLAAERGGYRAHFKVGLMYELGRGVDRDLARAYMWLSIAAETWREIATDRLALVEKKMTPTQVDKARKLVRECLKKRYKDC